MFSDLHPRARYFLGSLLMFFAGLAIAGLL
jgi:hypothetical protein